MKNTFNTEARLPYDQYDSKEAETLALLAPMILNAYHTLILEPFSYTTEESPIGGFMVTTKLDLFLNELVCQFIQTRHQEHQILSEESFIPHSTLNVQAATWVIDPVDGTTALSRGKVSGFCTSIGFAQDGEARIGMIIDPFGVDVAQGIIGKLWFAEKTKGAFLNGKRVQPRSDSTDLRRAFLSMQRIRTEKIAETTALDRFWEKLQTNRISYTVNTSQILAYLDAIIGQTDATIMNHGAMPWDIAAVAVIAHEVPGIMMTDLLGRQLQPLEKPNGVILAPPSIHEEIVALAVQSLMG